MASTTEGMAVTPSSLKPVSIKKRHELGPTDGFIDGT